MICASALVSGCATMSGDYCDVSRTITMTTRDVDTVSLYLLRQIVTHNEQRTKLCR